MSELTPIAELTFNKPLTPAAKGSWGQQPDLRWIAIDRLVVDKIYQRDILGDGKSRIRRIVENFRWSHFAPLVVAERRGDLFAVIDGQHHATAAKLAGVLKLPCCVVHCDPTEEASAFAAINGDVTRPNTLQIFHARLAAGETKAKQLRKVIDDAGVIVPRNIKVMNHPGETLAIGVLENCLARYRAEVLGEALQLITRTGDGNTGFVRAPIILALCELVADTAKSNRGFLKAVIIRASIPKLYASAMRVNAVDGGGVKTAFIAQLRKALERERMAA